MGEKRRGTRSPLKREEGKRKKGKGGRGAILVSELRGEGNA